jgi:hypothetical protein
MKNKIMKHYTKEELELYRNGKMSILGRITCSIHLKKCPKCSHLLVELSEDDILVDQLRSSIQLWNKLSSNQVSKTTNI